jgi:hypothetical protein
MTKFASNTNATCPHCHIVVQFPYTNSVMDIRSYNHTTEEMKITGVCCPNCLRLVVTIESGTYTKESTNHYKFEADSEHVVWPLQYVRSIPAEVPDDIARDYQEASATLNISPKASAALSRRCLQAVLRNAAKAMQHNLVDQIKHVRPSLPSYISDNVDAIRNIGNFAAHPIKDTASNQIVDVEPGEAEWNLDVLDMLFDFYYVQPAIARKRRDDLNTKLKAAGKKPM